MRRLPFRCVRATEAASSDIGPGEDDGSFVVGIEDKQGQPVVEVGFLISGAIQDIPSLSVPNLFTDTSDYPDSHSLFCHSLNSNIPPRLETLLESVVDQPARPLKGTIDSFFLLVADVAEDKTPAQVTADSESTGSDTEDYLEGSDSDSTSNHGDVMESKLNIALLQKYVAWSFAVQGSLTIH